MTSIIFVTGLCAVPDEKIKAYFSKFGSRVFDYAVQRRCATQPCCYSLIKYNSTHTANAVIRHRPHKIDNYPCFVKRLVRIDDIHIPINKQHFPATKLLIYGNKNLSHDIQRIENHFKLFGTIKYVKLIPTSDGILVKYLDYDSVDRFFECNYALQRDLTVQKVFPNDNQALSWYPTTCFALPIPIEKSALPIRPQVIVTSTNSEQTNSQIVSKSSNLTSQKTKKNEQIKVAENSQIIATSNNAAPVKQTRKSKKSGVTPEKANEVLQETPAVNKIPNPVPKNPELVSKAPTVPLEKENEVKKTEDVTKMQMTLVATGTNEPVRTNDILVEKSASASNDHSRSDNEVKLEKTITELKKCQTSLHEKEYECRRIQEDYLSLKCKNEELERLLNRERANNTKCPNCHDNESLIIRLRLNLDHLEDEQKYLKSLYEEALIRQKEQFQIIEAEHRSSMFRQKSISNRLVQYKRCEQEVCDSNSGSHRLSFPMHSCGVVPQQPLIYRSTSNRLHMQED